MLSLNRKILIAIILISLGLGFSGGFFVQKISQEDITKYQILTNQDEGRPEEIDFSLFWKTWNALNSKYVDKNKLDMQQLVYGAIKGMVSSVGDPYTVFFEPEISKKFQDEISGSFGGVGIEIGKRDGILTVISPIKDTPAYKAGIKAGDKILAVDDQSTADLTIEEVVNIIRGRKGTKVTLTISNKGEQGTHDTEIVRDTIKIPTVELAYIEDKIAYVQVSTFNQNVDSEFKKTAQDIIKSNADRIILDLRNNPGGLLDSAINLAGWFLNKGEIVVMEEFRDGTRNQFGSEGNGALKNYPIIILINGGSASASEILAGAIHDNNKARLVGEKTFGKGSVQELEKFDDGSSLKVTIAKWLTPLGVSITDKGIEADIEITIEANQFKEGELEIGIPGKDPQLDQAIELLK